MNFLELIEQLIFLCINWGNGKQFFKNLFLCRAAKKFMNNLRRDINNMLVLSYITLIST